MNARERLRSTVALFIGLLGIGTLGYRFIEGWGWFDSLYDTVITLSTVGDHEVHELSAGGRWFTVALLMGGFAGLALAVQALALRKQRLAPSGVPMFALAVAPGSDGARETQSCCTPGNRAYCGNGQGGDG